MNAYKAARLPIHRGPAAWNAILGAQDAPCLLDEDRTADVVIIGAGFAGLSAARQITQLEPALRVVVLDASRIAEGASGRNSGFMIDLPHELTSDDYAGAGTATDRDLIALNRQAIAFARSAVEDYGIDRNFFDECGKINGAAGEHAHRHNLSYANHLAGLGEAHEMLDGKQMQAITGSSHYLAGLYTPGTVMLQPAGYIRGLAAGLRKSGVAIFENAPATGFERTGNAWRVTTPRGSIGTERIVLANNGHLESFGIERGRLMQIFLYASMTEELVGDALARLGGNPRWGITPSDPMGTTMRRIDAGQGGNRIVTRTCAAMRPGMAASESDVARFAKVHERKFAQRFPQLAGVRQQFSWAGHLCLTLNGVSVMREIDGGVFSACVQNGLGTARGTLTGIGAAELALGKQGDITRHFGSQPRPNRLPPQPFAAIGANAWMRYKEWRAADE
ncbi:MAG: FAD-binding oxidoreductase [Rhodobiaceae bacterium]|nr:FAD-binding oxidoreductase [Rhodobiaceae bacterium]